MKQRLYIGNLSPETTAADLEHLLVQAGKTTASSIQVPLDEATGRARGFAFVEFVDEDSARIGRETFESAQIAGQPMRVSQASLGLRHRSW
ncbi:MAG: RNA recognition motif-containing protein [Planctomycetota bacterium]|jgi:RNA recognition motif-containing protein